MRVLVLSMVPERDWPLDEQIASELERLGHKAAVRKFLQDGRQAVLMERPDVALIPVVRCPYTRDFARRLKSWGITVVARRSEAGVSGRAYHKMPRRHQINQIGRYAYDDYIDMELVWGRQFADVLVAEKMVGPDKVRLIGAITLDVYLLPDYGRRVAELAGTKESFVEQHKLDPGKKIIFWACGFKMADVNPDYTLPEAQAGDPIHRELYERDRDGRRHWIEAINALFAKYASQYNFFVRPHPGESCKAYTDNLPAEVKVSLADAVARPMVHCDALIHAGSTLAVDAHVLKKPAISFYGSAEDNLIGDVSPRCRTVDELDAALAAIKPGQSNASIGSIHELEDFYGPIDGKACRRAAEAVHEFSDPSRRTPTSIPDQWPADEYADYTIEGVIKIANAPITYCTTCKKPFQTLNGQNQVACPHCGIATRTNSFVCVA